LADNAQFVFPEFFDGINDVFKSLSETEIIEEMKIKISLNPLNPFGDGIFIIRDGEYDIQCPLDNKSFLFELDKKDLDYINGKKDPFNPIFLILYPHKDAILGIPGGDIMITTISLNAKLKYNMELK